MANRLAASTSPYLLQHADNPVDWFEWGDDAFLEARRLDRPVLVSIGYAACHWCHVMAHESFEDPETAAYLNAHLVAVKVDREERPDVDAVYMEVTQAMTGQGGWPMTVFATPDGVPFLAGTYFPPRPAHGMPSFRQVLEAVVAGWRDHRDELLADAARVRSALAPQARAGAGGADEGADVGPAAGGTGVGPAARGTGVGPAEAAAAAARALPTLERTFDAQHGGFGGAPKFPPSMALEWLLRHHARTGSPSALTMAEGTLERMARGGMYDQLGGGFARYSVDRAWVVPHFEKMLYDNALLLRVYAHWWRATGSALARRVATETAELLVRELQTPEGGFASSLDADSPDAHGRLREGAFYAWTPRELAAALGPDDVAWAARVLGVTEVGTFEGGASVLQLPVDPDDGERWARVRAALLGARDGRARPARDDKVVAGWNGLAVAALAEVGALLEEPSWVAAAAGAARLLVDVHLDREGALLARTSRDGVAGTAAGVLEDYADVAEGFLALAQATGDGAWLRRAGTLLDAVLDRFADGQGAFYDTADDAQDPVLVGLARPREVGDGPTPSGSAAAAGALLTYAALTGSDRHREAAEGALTELLGIAERVPRAVGWALATAEALADGPREVAVVGRADDPAREELARAARRATAPGLVLMVGEADGGARAGAGGPSDVVGAPAAGAAGTDGPSGVVPLLLDRPLVDGRAAAYVRRGFVCRRPVTDADALAAELHP